MRRKRALDQCAHCGFRGTVGGGDWVEAAGAALVLDVDGAPEKRPDGLARNRSEFVDEGREIDCRHERVLLCGSSIEKGLLPWSMIFSENRCPLFGIMLKT